MMKGLLCVLFCATAAVAVATDDFEIIAQNLGAVTGLNFINATHGMIACTATLLRTEDGGYTWINSNIIDNAATRYYDVSSSGVNVVASGVGDTNAKPGSSYSLNSGVDYYKTDETHLRQQWYSVEPIPGHSGSFVKTGEWTDALRSGNGVSMSSNGGKTWTDHDWQVDTPARYASFVGSAKGWVAGGESPEVFDTNITRGVISSTSDGGWTWNKLTDSTEYYHNGIAFASDTVGWVTCITSTGSLIKKTTDGGKTWTTQVQMGDVKLQKLRMFSTTEGWAVGGYQEGLFYHGQILHTTDGGVSWASYAVRGVIFNDVDGFDKDHVYASGTAENSAGGVIMQWVHS